MLLEKESHDAFAQFRIGKAGANDPGRKKEIFQLHFAKEQKQEDIKNVTSRYAISTHDTGLGSINRGKKSQLKFPLTSRSNSSRLQQIKPDKRGQLHYLNKLDIVGVARRNNGAMYTTYGALPGANSARAMNMRFNPGEVERQFEKSFNSLTMKKFADIRNYNPSDNSVLQSDMNMMKTYTSLPKLNGMKKHPANLD